MQPLPFAMQPLPFKLPQATGDTSISECYQFTTEDKPHLFDEVLRCFTNRRLLWKPQVYPHNATISLQQQPLSLLIHK
jgi:hypothetical protein